MANRLNIKCPFCKQKSLYNTEPKGKFLWCNACCLNIYEEDFENDEDNDPKDIRMRNTYKAIVR